MRWRPANSRIHRGSTEMVLVLRWVAASTAGQDGVLSRCDQVNASTQASLFEPSWVWWRLLSHQENAVMAAPRKFDEETRQRAVRMYRERVAEHGDSKLAARKHVGALLDVKPETLRNWICLLYTSPSPRD